jgi:hypothetical protein
MVFKLMFGNDENINCIEALIPTEPERRMLLCSSWDRQDSIALTESFIANCSARFIWKDYVH